MQGLIRNLFIITLWFAFAVKANVHFSGNDSKEVMDQWLYDFHMSLLSDHDDWLQSYGLFMLSFDLDVMTDSDLQLYKDSVMRVIKGTYKEEDSLFKLLEVCTNDLVKDLCNRAALMEELKDNHTDNIMALLPSFNQALENGYLEEANDIIRVMGEANHAYEYMNYPPILVEQMRSFASTNPIPEEVLEYEMNWLIGKRGISEDELDLLRDKMNDYMFWFYLSTYSGGVPVQDMQGLLDQCSAHQPLHHDCQQIADLLINNGLDWIRVRTGMRLKKLMAEHAMQPAQIKVIEKASDSYSDFIKCLYNITFSLDFYQTDLQLEFKKDQVKYTHGEVAGMLHYAQALHRANPDDRSHPEVCLAKLNDNPLVNADRYTQYIND